MIVPSAATVADQRRPTRHCALTATGSAAVCVAAVSTWTPITAWVPRDPIAPGLHRLRIDQLGADGGVVARVESPFSRVAQADTSLSLREGSVVVQPGNSLWRIARRVYGEGMRYSVIYEANLGQIRDPDLIYPGQIFTLPEQQE